VKRRAALLRTYLGPHRRKASVLALLVCVNIVLTVVNPLWLGKFIDTATSHGAQSQLIGIALVFIGFTIANQIVLPVAGYLAEDIGWRATNSLRGDLAGHCLGLDLGFHHRHSPGQLLERVDGDAAKLGEFFSSFVFMVSGNILLALSIVAISFTVDWRFGLVLLSFAMVVVPLLRLAQRRAAPYFRRLREANTEISGFLEERIGATEDIRANGSSPYVRGRLDALLRVLTRQMRQESVAFRATSSVLELSVSLATAAVITIGAVLTAGGKMTIGQIYVGYFYASLLSLTMYRITLRLDSLQMALAATDRIAELRAEHSAVRDTGRVSLPPGALAIAFDQACFSYTAGNPTLREVSFEVRAGTSTGLIGRTGSGKTTIARLIYRAYDVDSGAIRLDGIDVKDVPLAELRARIGVVTQDVQLFGATIRDNLTLFDPAISDDQIMRAMAALGIDQWCRSLPEGLDTRLTDGGDSLSAGEAQLLAFARVFLRDPAVVVLDEASSRLDPGTERLVEEAIGKLLAGRTSLVIAHHLASVQRLDHIVVLDNGRPIEAGPRAELAADPDSLFAALLAEALV
jgi:ABC-type multidrug transport system fused ATPase/permease subunit